MAKRQQRRQGQQPLGQAKVVNEMRRGRAQIERGRRAQQRADLDEVIAEVERPGAGFLQLVNADGGWVIQQFN